MVSILASTLTLSMQQVGQMELLKKLHVFPEPGREVLYLRMFGNLSFREIGEVMGKTENWARVTFFRARTNLRKELEKDEEVMIERVKNGN